MEELNYSLSILNNSTDKISVWMGLSMSNLNIGPIFYEVNLKNNMLNEEIIPQLQDGYRHRFERLWWMQDRAPCHRNNCTENTLIKVFGTVSLDLGML